MDALNTTPQAIYDRARHKKRYLDPAFVQHKREVTRAWDAANPERKKANHTRRYIARRAFLDWLSEATMCLDCESSWPPVCMDFDHVRGEKLFNIAKWAIGGSLEELQTELLKCEPVCSNCHRLRTQARRKAS